MKIGIDLDGCLANFNEGFREVLVKTSGRELVPAGYDPEVWHWPQHVGYTEAEVHAAWEYVKTWPWFWRNLQPLPGARAFLDWLWRRGGGRNSALNFVTIGTNTPRLTAGCDADFASPEVYFITSRPGVLAQRQSEFWLQGNGWDGQSTTVLIARGSKGQIAKSLGLTHFFDDRPENIEDVLRARPSCRTFLRDCLHNRSVQRGLTAAGTVVVPDVAGLQKELEGLLVTPSFS